MAKIVRFKGFNLESDVFVYLVSRLERTPIAKKIYQTAWDFIARGKGKLAVRAIEKYTEKFVKRVSNELHQYVLDKVDPLMQVQDPRFDPMAAKILAQGVVSDMQENPMDYLKYLTSAQQDEANAIIEERGKSKFLTMLDNKGLLASEDVARELVKIAKELMAGEWIVEQHIGNGWENVWEEDDEPMTFRSRSEAKRELKEHLEDTAEAGMDYDERDFRIVRASAKSREMTSAKVEVTDSAAYIANSVWDFVIEGMSLDKAFVKAGHPEFIRIITERDFPFDIETVRDDYEPSTMKDTVQQSINKIKGSLVLEELIEKNSVPAAVDVKYLVVGIGGPRGRAFKTDDVDKLIRFMKQNGHRVKGTNKKGRFGKPFLVGQPIFDGMAGPMADGKNTVRYETWEANERLSI